MHYYSTNKIAQNVGYDSENSSESGILREIKLMKDL